MLLARSELARCGRHEEIRDSANSDDHRLAEGHAILRAWRACQFACVVPRLLLPWELGPPGRVFAAAPWVHIVGGRQERSAASALENGEGIAC